MASSQSSVKEQMIQIIEAQPEDSSFDEILRELAKARAIERGLEDDSYCEQEPSSASPSNYNGNRRGGDR